MLLVQPTDDEDEDEDYYDDSDCGSDDEYDWDMPAVHFFPLFQRYAIGHWFIYS